MSGPADAVTENVVRENGYRPLEPSRIKQDYFASELVLPLSWQGPKHGAVVSQFSKDLGNSILTDLLVPGTSPALTAHQDSVVASKVEEQLQHLESKFAMQQKQLETVLARVEKETAPTVVDLLDLRRSFDVHNEKQEYQAGRLQTIVAGMEHLLSLHQEEQAKAAQVAEATKQELAEVRADVSGLKQEVVDVANAAFDTVATDLGEVRGTFGEHKDQQLVLHAAVEDLKRMLVETNSRQDASANTALDCLGIELKELRDSLSKHKNEQDFLVDALKSNAEKLERQVDGQEHSTQLVQLHSTLVEQASRNDGVSQELREGLQRLEEHVAAAGLQAKLEMSQFDVKLSEFRNTVDICTEKHAAGLQMLQAKVECLEQAACSAQSEQVLRDFEGMRRNLEQQLQRASGKLRESVAADVAGFRHQLEAQQQSFAKADERRSRQAEMVSALEAKASGALGALQAAQDSVVARVSTVEARTLSAMDAVQATQSCHDGIEAKICAVEATALEAAKGVQDTRAARSDMEARVSVVEVQSSEAVEAVQAIRVAHGSVAARVSAVEAEAAVATRRAQDSVEAKVSAVEAKAFDALGDLQAAQNSVAARVSTVEAESLAVSEAVQATRTCQDGLRRRICAVEAKTLETAEGVQATRLARGDMEARVKAVEDKLQEPSAASQIAAMDAELDAVRSAFDKEQARQLQVAQSLWTDAGCLRENLQGQQGQLTALQRQFDQLACRLKCGSAQPEPPPPTVPGADLEKNAEGPLLRGKPSKNKASSVGPTTKMSARLASAGFDVGAHVDDAQRADALAGIVPGTDMQETTEAPPLLGTLLMDQAARLVASDPTKASPRDQATASLRERESMQVTLPIAEMPRFPLGSSQELQEQTPAVGPSDGSWVILPRHASREGREACDLADSTEC